MLIHNGTSNLSAQEKRVYVRLLADLPISDERNKLLFEFITLCDRMDAFITQEKKIRIRELDQQRDTLWSECRLKEDQVKILSEEVARFHQQLNEAGFRLGELRAKAQEISSTKPYGETRFPSVQELDSHMIQCQEASDARDKEEKAIGQINIFLASAKEREKKSRFELQDMVGQLGLLDYELARLKQ